MNVTTNGDINTTKRRLWNIGLKIGNGLLGPIYSRYSKVKYNNENIRCMSRINGTSVTKHTNPSDS